MNTHSRHHSTNSEWASSAEFVLILTLQARGACRGLNSLFHGWIQNPPAVRLASSFLHTSVLMLFASLTFFPFPLVYILILHGTHDAGCAPYGAISNVFSYTQRTSLHLATPLPVKQQPRIHNPKSFITPVTIEASYSEPTNCSNCH